MPFTDVKLGPQRVRLVEEMRATIIKNSIGMSYEDIMMSIGFVCGMAVSSAPTRTPSGARIKPSHWRQLVIANIDKGLELAQMGDKGPSIILPN